MSKLGISKTTVIFAVVTLIAGLVARWYFSNFDKEAFTVDRGYSVEARRNPFLAAEKFLTAKKVNFETRKNFSLFDEPVGQFDTILINSSRVGMSSARRKKMHEWVKGGGHLLLLATEPFDYDFNGSRDKFLDDLGLRYYKGDYAFDSEESELAKLDFEGYEVTTKINFRTSSYIEDASGEAYFAAGTDYGEQIIQYALDEGLVTVIMDFSIWNNFQIDQHDHAMFLVQLIGNSPKVWLLYNRVQPSLIMLAWDTVPMLIISSVVLLLLLLFSHLWRQGVPRKDTSAVHREIMQHIGAAGEFNYRSDKGRELSANLLDLINHQMSQLCHGYLRLSEADQLERLLHFTGIPKKQLALLFEHEHESYDVFLSKVKLVQQIRKHL